MNSELEALSPLVGEWTTEATHPAFAGMVVNGRVEVGWLEGEQFLIHRAWSDHPDFPDSISVIGVTEELSMHYFDSRGVHRVYRVAASVGEWRIWRDGPGFSQRFTGTFSDDANTLSGVWELSQDDSTWADDLQITYRRAG